MARGPMSREPLSRNDAEALESAALVLGLIERADDQTFADLETVRQILEYDELLPRLYRVRGPLPAEDRPGPALGRIDPLPGGARSPEPG